MTSTSKTYQDRAEKIGAAYEQYGTTGLPSPEAWARLAQCAPDARVTLVNFFKLRDRASYPSHQQQDEAKVAGQSAFDRYAAVSMPSLAKVGGGFLLVAPFGGAFVGSEEDWDLVAVGTYPSPDAVLALFELEEYRECYMHRIAACVDQRVSLCLG